MHILFLADNFPPEVNAPASRTYEHCREWVRAGQRVTVVTCVPNFPKGTVYDGYRNRLFQTESMEGIRVVRVWSYITANEGVAKRIADYLSFMVTAILASSVVRKPDVVVGTSPQFFTVCAASVVARLKRIPFVFELRDLWPESIKAVGAIRDSAAIRFLERIEMGLYRRASKIVSVTHSFKEVLTARGVAPGKIEVVTNGVDMARFRPTNKDPELETRLGLQGRLIAGYIGTHGMAHALETVLEAAQLARRRENGDAIHFVLLGDGARKAELVRKSRAMRLDNVTFIDSVPKDEVVRYWSLLDVAIIHLRKTHLFTTVIPSKLFECMGMGLPVLHGVAGESAEIVRGAGCGVVFEPENAQDLCDNLFLLGFDQDTYREMQKNSLRAAERYDRSRLALEMLSVLKKTVGGVEGGEQV